jgi:hypothetical protein
MRLWLLPLVAVAACGHDNSQSVTQYHAYLQAAESTSCQALQKCCGTKYFADAAACVSSFDNSLFKPTRTSDAALLQGKVIFDQAKAQTCLTRLQQAMDSCDNAIDFQVIDAFFCAEAFTGTLRIGQSCNASDGPACVPGADCNGRCVAANPSGTGQGTVGQPCHTAQDCQSYQCDVSQCAPAKSATQYLCSNAMPPW